MFSSGAVYEGQWRDTDVTEEGWYGQPRYCYNEKAIHVAMISFAVVFGLLAFLIRIVLLLLSLGYLWCNRNQVGKVS